MGDGSIHAITHNNNTYIGNKNSYIKLKDVLLVLDLDKKNLLF